MTVLHVDMDAFFASVEQRDHPEYRGKPVIVGAPRDRRGVVSTCSYEARAFGVHSAMPSREAARLCPQGIFLPGDHARYAAVSAQVMEILSRFTPVVEQVSIDEAYLDVSGAGRLFGDGAAIGAAIRSAIRGELGLTASVGSARSKLVAKICSELAKPDGLKVAPDGDAELAAFLAPLPLRALPGVGKTLGARLASFGYRIVRDIQQASLESLVVAAGPNAADFLKAAAFGVDDRAVGEEREELSISREHTFDEDCSDREVVRETLHELVRDVGRRLRAAGRRAGEVHLKLRWSDFTTITRQKPTVAPLRDDFTLFEEALALFGREKLVAPVRLVGFGVSSLVEGEGQVELDLFGGGSDTTPLKERREKLSDAVDSLRRKFGRDVFGRRRGGDGPGGAASREGPTAPGRR